MGKSKKCIIFISDQFGYRCGGSNTINFELCMALCQIVTDDSMIISLVLNSKDDERIKELEKKAEDLGIRIISRKLSKENTITDIECKEIYNEVVSDQSDMDSCIWIGHDIFTGHFAIRLAKFCNGLSAVCIHTDYDTIEGLKGIKGQGIEKEGRQRKIIKDADKVFAIGPRLMERVSEVRKSDIFELIPGVTTFEENVLMNKRAVISYGRFEGNVALVKQVQLVLAAFGKAVAIMNNNRDYVLHIIGTPDGDEEERLREIAERYANGRKLSINFLEYTQDKKKLFSCLMNNCAGLMVSISEGFGLAGWEMISAGIPLILTKKSGLYDYLEKRFGYMANGMCLPVDLKGSSNDQLCEEDVNKVANKIVMVFKNTDQMKNAAKELKGLLRDETWYRTAGKLADGIGIKTNYSGAKELYSETYRTRQDCIEEILNQLEMGYFVYQNLVFFGGISTALCEERAIKKIERWLINDKTRRLFICYETGEAASERARELDEEKLPNDGLPKKPEDRMKAKEERINESFKKYVQDVREQIRMIKIKNSLMTYVIMLDENIYFTLLSERRSSEMMTMKIRENLKEEKRKIIESMKYVICKQELGNSEQELLIILDKNLQ